MQRENRIINYNLRAEYHIDSTVQSIMECVAPRVSKKLYKDMMGYLLGFNNDMQLEIADNLLDAVCYGWQHYIGIRHIDNIMKNFYFLIETEISNQSN